MFTLAAFLISLTLATDPVFESDINRFPWSAAECLRAFNIATEHHRWLLANRKWDTDWVNEAFWRRECWNALHALKTTTGLGSWRRAQFAALRDCIGRDDYYLGRMPDYLPSWRFVER